MIQVFVFVSHFLFITITLLWQWHCVQIRWISWTANHKPFSGQRSSGIQNDACDVVQLFCLLIEGIDGGPVYKQKWQPFSLITLENINIWVVNRVNFLSLVLRTFNYLSIEIIPHYCARLPLKAPSLVSTCPLGMCVFSRPFMTQN